LIIIPAAARRMLEYVISLINVKAAAKKIKGYYN